MTKRIIALLLALILTVGLLPTVALAAEETVNNDVVPGSIGTDGKWSQTPPTQPKVDGVKTVDKTAEKVAGTDNQYKVTLTVVLEQTEEEQKPGAAATVLVLDTSGSMAYCAECGAEPEEDCEHNYAPVSGAPSEGETYYYKTNENGQVRFREANYCNGVHKGRPNKRHPAGWFKTEWYERDHNTQGDALSANDLYIQPSRASRLDAAKVAAENFLKTYSGLKFNTDGTVAANQTDRNLGRYVSVVTFATGVTLRRDWIDVSNPAGYKNVLGVFTGNSLKAKGATNLDAGLTYAEYLLNDKDVNGAVKNVIALTDGEPTFYLSNSYWCNDDDCKSSDTVSIGNTTYYVHGSGRACSSNTKTATENAAASVKKVSNLYTVCFGVANDKMKQWMDPWNSNNVTYWKNLTVGQYLESLASKEEGKTFAYAASNANELNAAFAAITHTIVSGLDTGTVNDTLPTGITGSTATANGQAITSPMTWKLDDDFDVERTKTEGDKKVTTYTYTKTYYVTINPETVVKTKIGNDEYAPLNGETTLTVEVAGEEKTIPFPIPAGKVTPKEYTVKGIIDNGGKVNNTDSPYTETVESGKTSKAMTFTPAAGYEIKTITEKIGDGQPATITVTDKNSYTYPAKGNVNANITVDVKTAKRSDLKYVVKHVEKDNATNVLATRDKTGTLDEVIHGEAQKENFTGFTYAECLPESIKISAAEDSNVITLYYTRNKHNITYQYEGTPPADAPALTSYNDTDVPYGTEKERKDAPSLAGWTFEGWTTEDVAVGSNGKFNMPDKDVTFTGKWTKNADAGYTIEYYLETLTEGTFEKDNNRTISDRTGTIGTTASVTEADKKQITGFTFDANNTNNKLEGEIVSGDPLTLKLYYTRNSYTVKYEYTGTVIPQNATKLPDEATYKYGAEVTVAAAATSADHVFSGWSRIGKFDMPAENVIITGSWTQATYNVDLSPYVKKTLEVDGTLPTGFSETFKVNVTVDGQPQQQGTVTMTADGTSSFNMPTVALTKGVHTIMVQEVVDGSTKNSNIEYDTNQKTFVLNIPTSGAAAPVQYGTTNSDGSFVEVKEPAFVTITNKYTQPTKSFDLNTLVIKKFVLADNSKPIPTGEGISYTFSVAVTPLDDNGERDWDNGFTGVVTLYGENTTGVSFDFGANQYLTFDTSGEHRYVVSEIPGALSNVIYDNTAYLLTLSVKDDLSIVPTITDYTEEASTLSLGEIVPATNKITFTNKYSEKQDPDKLTIRFSDFVKKELTATGTKTANDVDFRVNVNGYKVEINSLIGEEISTYDEPAPDFTTTLGAHFDSITGGETKTAPFNGSIQLDRVGCYFFNLSEEDGQRTGVTYDETRYMLTIYVSFDEEKNELYVSRAYATCYNAGTWGDEINLFDMVNDKPVRNNNYITFHNTIDTGRDDYIPIIIPTIINKDTGMLNKTDHFAYVIGYPDGTVHPNGQITRAEVATIFFRLLRDEVRDGAFTTSNTYSDVAYGKWYNNPISTMSALGIITGYPDGTFKPNKPITRAEFAAIAARFDETQSGKSATFSDVIGHWAAKEIGIAYYNDWIKGYPDGTFKPDQNITRAEAMTLINRVLERKPESPADLLTNMNKWTDNLDTSKWYYLDVQEATNSHSYTRKTFNYELWRQMLPDPDWSRYER